jgi:hypothetical protein
VTSFPLRVLRAALLHADTYEEVEADASSIGQAFVVVLVACVAGGTARWMIARELPADEVTLQVTASALEPLVLWLLGSAFAFMVGASFFRGPETETDYLEVLRTTGFAFGPAVLRFFAFLPPPSLGLAIDVAARGWMFVAVVVALRQALDYTTLRAVGTFGLAAVLVILVMLGLSVAPF